MNDKRIIIALHNLADDLDQTGLYKYSEEIDGIATRLAILNLPLQRLDHPGTDNLRRNYLEPLPPQNLLETLYQDFAGYGKPLPKVKLPFFPETNIDWTPDRFFADVIRDFEGTGHINNDFQDLLILSPKFVDLLHDYVFVKNEHHLRLREKFKEMIETGEFALTYKLRAEFKKLKSVYRDSNKTNIRRVLPALLKISEILPTELLSEVQAMNEWLEQQWTNETEIYDAERAYEPRYIDKLDANEELKDYLSPTDEELENLQRTSVSNRMNKRKIIASINKIANELDNSGLHKEATSLTKVMKRLAADEINFDPRQKSFPLDTYNAMGPARGDLSGYQQITESDEPKSKVNEELKRRTLDIIESDEYKDWEIKRAIGSLVNYVAEPDSRQEYHQEMEDMYPLGRPIPKSQTLMLKLMEMTDSYIKENDLSYKQIKDLYFTFMDIK
jgi:hypothetical protein